jgi:hypothetical protein
LFDILQIDTQMVKDSTIKFLTGTVQVADQFVQKTSLAPGIQTALDVVESYLPQEEPLSIASAVEKKNFASETSSMAPSDSSLVHRADPTVLFRAGI